jgi:hypothetical protein
MKRGPIILCGVFLVCVAGVMVEWSNREAIASSIAEFESYDHRDGKKEAEADIAQGRLKWKVSGRVSDYEVRRTLLKEKLGLELDWFTGCIGSEGIERYRLAYNSVIWTHATTIYGEAAVQDMLGDHPKKWSVTGEEK